MESIILTQIVFGNDIGINNSSSNSTFPKVPARPDHWRLIFAYHVYKETYQCWWDIIT